MTSLMMMSSPDDVIRDLECEIRKLKELLELVLSCLPGDVCNYLGDELYEEVQRACGNDYLFDEE